MSIWASIGSDEVRAARCWNGERMEGANYSGEGPLDVIVDVARTGLHDKIRLGLWTDSMDLDVEVLVSASAGRELAARLVRAAEIVEGRA